MLPDNPPHNALRHHVTGAIERGEAAPIVNVPPAKPLAKSLHTITVLARVARHLIECGAATGPESAIRGALDLLGYAGTPDPYGLASRALAIVGK